MENVLYNDLIRRGYDVDVGVVEIATMEDSIALVSLRNFGWRCGDKRAIMTTGGCDKEQSGSKILMELYGNIPHNMRR